MKLVIEIDDASGERLLRDDPSYIAWGDACADTDTQRWATDEEKYTVLLAVKRARLYGG